MKYTEEEMKALAAELLEVDLELPSVCETCGHELENNNESLI